MRLFLALLLSPLFALCLEAAPVRTDHVTAEIISEFAYFKAGSSGHVALRLEIIPHWHTYWQNPGDSGLPTRVIWKLPAGWKTSAPQWEVPERISVPPLVNFGYSGETLLGFWLEIPAGTKPGNYELGAVASWLVCKEECIPEKVDLTFTARVAEDLSRENPFANAFTKLSFLRLRIQQPQALPKGKNLSLLREEKQIGLVTGDADVRWLGEKPDFFPLEASVIDGKKPPRREKNILWFDKAEPYNEKASGLRGILVVKQKGELSGKGFDKVVYQVDAPFESAPTAVASSATAPPALLGAILFAFLGGLLLNLMPCVFPVLGIKVMSLLESSGGDVWRARLHGKVYAAGVMVSFWALTAALLLLRGAGEAVGWGFQLQQPAFVIALAFLFLGLAGNLAGFFEVGGRWMGFGSRLAEREGWSGSFFTGVLAVVVATPCSAPFMGSAIGLVISQPAWEVFGVFTSLAMGLAFPFVLLAYWPSLLRRMPRPGNWMVRVKEFFAFPMLATVLWLLWVLGQQRGLDAVILCAFGLLLLSFAAWTQAHSHTRLGKVLAFVLAILALVVGFSPLKYGASPKVGVEGAWQIYSDAALKNALAEKKPVFVDFTAAWCLTCQVNKKLVLDREGMQEFFRERGVTLLLADWTNRDSEITNALARYGRIGVPLYLSFRKGEAQPQVLPQVLTESIVRQSLE